MRCLSILLLLLVFNQALAQKIVKAADMPIVSKPTEIRPKNGDSATYTPALQDVPFSRIGNLIVLKAIADTTEGNFILDTGAPGLVLNITYFRQYPSAETDERSSISGTVVGAVQTKVNKFAFGGLEFKQVKADMISLGHIEDRKGIKILGLIGLSFFKDLEMIVDYEKGVIHLHRITKKEGPTYRSKLLDSANYNTLKFDVVDNKMILYLKLGERKMKFFLDTGAESNVLDSRLPNKVFESITITGRTKLMGAGNRSVEALYGNLRNIRVGDKEIASLPFVITTLENVCISEVCCIDGILGFEFLSLHKVGFNFIKREMYIWK